jgi:hypothetical protein
MRGASSTPSIHNLKHPKAFNCHYTFGTGARICHFGSQFEYHRGGNITHLPNCRAAGWIHICRSAASSANGPIASKWSSNRSSRDISLGDFASKTGVRVLQAPGVKQIVGIGNTPAPISDSEIENLKTLVSSGSLLAPWPYLYAGQRIRIDRGALPGIEGFVVRAEQGEPRIVVSVNLLQRSVAAEISRECISFALAL